MLNSSSFLGILVSADGLLPKSGKNWRKAPKTVEKLMKTWKQESSIFPGRYAVPT
jgi:hypothetical protein